MTTQEHTSTRELINQIELKDRRFRLAWLVFIFFILLVLIGVIVVQLRTLDGVREQLKQQEILLNEQKTNTEDLKNTTAKVSQQIDCIAEFFAQRERATATIANLEQCTIVRPDGSIITPNFSRGAAPAQSPTATPDQQPATTNSAGSGQTPQNPQQPQDPIVPPLPEQPRPPAEILGIPICVPFTSACVR